MKAIRTVVAMKLLMLASALTIGLLHGPTSADAVPITVLTVDCTPLVTPGPSSYGDQNTMGMGLMLSDPAGVCFTVTEVTPLAFRLMTVADLTAFDLIAILNHPGRIDCGSGLGIGTTWQTAIGVVSGGRIVLTSHDAVRFHMLAPPGGFAFGAGPPLGALGIEPFGAVDFVKQAALWAGSGDLTGLIIFNDAPGTFVPGVGWDNSELNLPPLWGISNSTQDALAGAWDGGYTDILAAFAGHPIYTGLSDVRFDVKSISSFAANIGDASYHSVFASFDASIFTKTEEVINAGIVDVGGFCVCGGIAAAGPDGLAITLIRDEVVPVQAESKTWGRIKGQYR